MRTFQVRRIFGATRAEVVVFVCFADRSDAKTTCSNRRAVDRRGTRYVRIGAADNVAAHRYVIREINVSEVERFNRDRLRASRLVTGAVRYQPGADNLRTRVRARAEVGVVVRINRCYCRMAVGDQHIACEGRAGRVAAIDRNVGRQVTFGGSLSSTLIWPQQTLPLMACTRL